MTRVRLDPPSPVLFSTPMDVRVTDLNYGRHLGHMELVGLLHEARVAFLREHGYAEFDVEGLALMVVDLAVSYRSEAFAGQTLVIDLGIALEGSRGAEIGYAVRDQKTSTLVALAKTGIVFADPVARKVVQVPESIRRLAGWATG